MLINALIDFEGFLISLNKSEWFENCFSDYERIAISKDDNTKDRTSAINDSEGLLVSKFSNYQKGPERNTILVISENFVCIDISCDDQYTQIDEFLYMMINILTLLFQTDRYAKIKRVAIRKIDGEIFPNGREADNIFEYFDQGVTDENDRYFQRTYTDNFVNETNNVYVNYTRKVRISGTEPNTFSFVLDIDTYIDSTKLDNLRSNPDDLATIFHKRLNETAFDLFKRGVKIEYLVSKIKNH